VGCSGGLSSTAKISHESAGGRLELAAPDLVFFGPDFFCGVFAFIAFIGDLRAGVTGSDQTNLIFSSAMYFIQNMESNIRNPTQMAFSFPKQKLAFSSPKNGHMVKDTEHSPFERFFSKKMSDANDS